MSKETSGREYTKIMIISGLELLVVFSFLHYVYFSIF